MMHSGITSVSVAAHKGREEIVKMLISAGADVNIDSNNGSTPLIQASHFGEYVPFVACWLLIWWFGEVHLRQVRLVILPALIESRLLYPYLTLPQGMPKSLSCSSKPTRLWTKRTKRGRQR